MGKLLLVGCGKMGGAMLDGWLSRGLAASDVLVAEPVEALRPHKAGLRAVGSTSDVSETPEIVVQRLRAARVLASPRGGGVRFSPHFYCDGDDIARCCDSRSSGSRELLSRSWRSVSERTAGSDFSRSQGIGSP